MQATRSLDLAMQRRARRVIQLTLASLALGGGAAAAWAGAEPGAPKGTPQAQQQAQQAQGGQDKAAAEAAFVKADADKDGKLSRGEAGGLPAIAARFDELDRDKDGSLSMAEFMSAFGAAK